MAVGTRPSADYGSEAGARARPSLLAVLLRRAPLIILVALLSTGAAAAFAYLGGDAYESRTKLLFLQTIGPEQVAQGLQPGAPDADNLAQDNVERVDSYDVAVATSDILRRRGIDLSADDVDRDVTVSKKKDADVVEIVATADSGRTAAALANTYTAVARRQAARAQRGVTRRALRSVNEQLAQLSPAERRGPAGADLHTRQGKLRTLADAGTGSPQVIQRGAVPDSKSHNTLEIILLGGLFGLVLGVGIGLLREQLDSRLHHPEDVSAAFEAPVLTTVPRSRKLKKNVPFPELPVQVAEAFRMLQMNLRFGRDRPVRNVLITSSRTREGKTTVAWNLACAAASAGLDVAFVEADLRRPSIAERYGLEAGPGLVDVLHGEVSVASALQRFALRPASEGNGGQPPPVHVLVAGKPVSDPWRLMQSQPLDRVLDNLERDFELVVIDTPPIPHVADPIALLRKVDGVIVVASVNTTRSPEAGRLRVGLQALGANVLGVVANGGSTASGYAYAPAVADGAAGAVNGDGRTPVAAGRSDRPG